MVTNDVRIEVRRSSARVLIIGGRHGPRAHAGVSLEAAEATALRDALNLLHDDVDLESVVVTASGVAKTVRGARR